MFSKGQNLNNYSLNTQRCLFLWQNRRFNRKYRPFVIRDVYLKTVVSLLFIYFISKREWKNRGKTFTRKYTSFNLVVRFLTSETTFRLYSYFNFQTCWILLLWLSSVNTPPTIQTWENCNERLRSWTDNLLLTLMRWMVDWESQRQLIISIESTVKYF